MMPSAKTKLRIPTPPQLQEPRQRGHLGLGAGALPAAPGRGGRRVHPHRDLRHAADRRGRPRRRRALGRQGPRQGRRAARQLRAGHRHQGAGDGARRGLLGPPHRRRDQGVRPRRRPRAAGLGARRQGGLEGSQAARPRDPHDRSVAAEALRQVRADRRHVDLPDEGREDRRGPRHRSASSSTSSTPTRRPPPTTCCSSSRCTRSSRASSRAASASPGAPRRCPAAATGRCRSSRCPARCSSATPAAWSTRSR